MDIVSTNLNTMPANVTSTVSLNFQEKVTSKIDCYIFHTVILVIMLIFVICIICYHCAKQVKTKKHIVMQTI